MKTKIQWRCTAQVYFNFGSIYSTDITADTKEELIRKKRAFVLTERMRGNVEVISFTSFIETKTTIHEGTDTAEAYVAVDEIVNDYVSESFKEKLR